MISGAVVGMAFAVSTDAFAASLAKGAQFPRLTWRRTAAIAGSFATLEAFAPLAGWLIGREAGQWLTHLDHWIAFGLLGLLGLSMIFRGGRAKAENSALSAPTWLTIALVALATSIDAVAVGLTLALVLEQILPALAVIAAVTFIMTWAGLRLGRSASFRLGRVVETLGGLTLIAIGTKILAEHLLA